MAKKSFLLVSLKESKAKKLAEVISNKTCRKILDYLADKKDATESQIAKDLGVPISTVHYNMKALMTARLVKSDEYHYSSKGKEVSHYRLANQYVIIAPEGEKHALREKLKSIIPTALIMGAAASIIKLFSDYLPASMEVAKTGGARNFMAAAPQAAMDDADMILGEAAEEAAYESVRAAADEGVAEAQYAAVKTAAEAMPAPEPLASASQAALDRGTDVVVEHAPDVMPTVWDRCTDTVSHAPEIALWFFIGAVAGVCVYLLVDYIVKRIRDR